MPPVRKVILITICDTWHALSMKTNMKNMSKGFSLVELLIVIAIIAILTVGMLTALNPIETTRKAQDTTMSSTATQVFDAFDRYYTSRLTMPWCPSSGICIDPANPTDFASSDALQNLIANADLRSTFSVPGNEVFYYGNNDNATAVICYMPLSDSIQHDKNTKFKDMKGTVDASNYCKANNGSNNCYWCLQ